MKNKLFKWLPDNSCQSEFTGQNRACQHGDIVDCNVKY